MTRKKILIYCIVSVASVSILVYLSAVSDPASVDTVPIAGSIFVFTRAIFHIPQHNSTAQSGADASAQSHSHMSHLYTIGTQSVADTIHPVGGSSLSPHGKYADGSFTGVAAMQSGLLILQIAISQGRITDIVFQSVPPAVPAEVTGQLQEEAIKNQVVEVSPVKGYDIISAAFNAALANGVQKSFKN